MGNEITFDNTYGSSVTAPFKACIVAAEDLIQTLFAPKKSVTISVDFNQENAGKTGWALENTPAWTQVSYSKLTGALPASDVLPASNPAPSGSWWVPDAYGRMLGISTATPASGKFDDAVTLNTYYGPWSYAQDVINGLVHELSEGSLGRVGGLGGKNGATGDWEVMDLFRYNSAGQYDVTDGRDGQTTYFSSNGGATLSQSAGLSFFNNYNTSGKFTSGDSDDWNQQSVFGSTGGGETLTMTQTELNVMKSLGWTISLPQDIAFKTGNWQTATNWSNGVMPIAPEDVFIGGLSAVTTTTSNNVTVNSIGTNTISTLVVNGDSTLTASNGTVTNPEATYVLAVGNLGVTQVDAGSTLVIGNGFDNEGTLDIGYSPANGGNGDLVLNGTVTLDGGGTVNLGNYANQNFSTGAVSGGGLINVDDKIIGGGSIYVTNFDNQTNGVIDANQSEGNWLSIGANTFSNEGGMNVEERATLDLGRDGATEKLTNAGSIDVGWDGSHANSDADLAISGALTLVGGGSVAMKGAGARIISDAQVATLNNESKIDDFASGQIGDAGVYGGGVNDLTFNNYGTTLADGAGVTLTLNTGANMIGDGGGMLEAENGATLAIDSNVATGERRFGLQVPPGGTIEAAAGGTVTLSSSVFDGITGSPSVAGQVVVQAGGLFKVLSGGSVLVPVDIYGASGGQASGVFDDMSGVLNGKVDFESAGATLELNHNASTVDVTGSGGTIDLTSASVSVSGGSNQFDFAAKFLGDTISGFTSSDQIQLADFGSWSALQSHITQSGANTTITLDANDFITLDNVQKSSLTASQFSFV